MKILNKIVNTFLDMILPKNCIGCNRRGSFLCEDCLSLIDINLDTPIACNGVIDICSPASRKEGMMKKVIDETRDNFQIKDLCLPIAAIILTHLSETRFSFPDGCLLSYAPIPNKEARLRGFDQAREITKVISDSTGIPIYEAGTPLQGKDIILFDDLYDIERVEPYAKSMKDKGAKRIIYLPAAR